jgi:hypothetical protein
MTHRGGVKHRREPSVTPTATVATNAVSALVRTDRQLERTLYEIDVRRNHIRGLLARTDGRQHAGPDAELAEEWRRLRREAATAGDALTRLASDVERAQTTVQESLLLVRMLAGRDALPTDPAPTFPVSDADGRRYRDEAELALDYDADDFTDAAGAPWRARVRLRWEPLAASGARAAG